MLRIFALLFALSISVAHAQVTPGTSPLSIAKGGTGGGTASAARGSLGVPGIPVTLANGGLGADQSAATANQIPVYPGSVGGAVPRSASTWFDNAYCNTVGYVIVRLTGAWTCSQGVPVNATWFGVVADASTAFNSTNATTNTTPLTNAIATGQCVFFPVNSNGYSLPSNALTISTNQCISNPNQVFLKAQPGSGGWVFHITAFQVTGGNAQLNNIKVDTTGASSGSTVFRFATSSAVVAGAQLTRLLCTNSYECIGDETSASNYVLDIKIYDVRAELTLGRQVYIRRSRGFMWIDTLRIDQTQSGQTTPVTWASARFEDMIGLEINRYDSVGPSTTQTTTYQSTSNCLEIVGTGSGHASVWLNRILCDSGSGNGPLIDNVSYVMGNWIESFQNLGNGIVLGSSGAVDQSQFSNMFVIGGVGITGAAASANGITCNPCTKVQFANIGSSFNTGSGLSIAGASSGVTASNFSSYSNGSNALVLAGTSSNAKINMGQIGSNGGTVSNSSSGSGNSVQNVIGYNPVGLTAGTSTGTTGSTISAGTSPETHYITQSATFNAVVKLGATTICTVATSTVPCVIDLGPNESYSVTWSTTQPTYSKFVH